MRFETRAETRDVKAASKERRPLLVVWRITGWLVGAGVLACVLAAWWYESSLTEARRAFAAGRFADAQSAAGPARIVVARPRRCRVLARRLRAGDGPPRRRGGGLVSRSAQLQVG